MKKRGIWLVLALAAVSLEAAGVESVFREDFTGGRLVDGGRLCGEAQIVDSVFGKALKVPGKAGSFVQYPAERLREVNDFTLTLWFRMKPRMHDEKGRMPLNGFAAFDWAWWFDMNGGTLCDGVLDTPSWEGQREGIDDIRYATKLRQEIVRVRRQGSTAAKEKAEEADAWLNMLDARASLAHVEKFSKNDVLCYCGVLLDSVRFLKS